MTAVTEQGREVHGGGTWGPPEAVAQWRRGAAARLRAFGPATEMMLDLVKVAEGSRILDVGAGAGDSTLVAAQRVGSSGHVSSHRRLCEHVGGRRGVGTASGAEQR